MQASLRPLLSFHKFFVQLKQQMRDLARLRHKDLWLVTLDLYICNSEKEVETIIAVETHFLVVVARDIGEYWHAGFARITI
jgi:hypothetical protein